MNATKPKFLGALFGFLFMGLLSTAQEQKEVFVTVTTFHWNMEMQNFVQKDWLAIEKEYLDKVVKKNEFILGQTILTHYFTADNTELLLVTSYANWDAIEKAGDRSDELVKLAWPDEKARNAFFDKKQAYYQLRHSDEIYKSFPGAKVSTVKFDKPMLYYVRKSHFDSPKDGTDKEFDELFNKYRDAVTMKNDFVKAYYPNVHAWGSDKTEFTEVYVVETLADVEKALDKSRDLFNLTWNDDAKKKDFDKRYGKYFTGVHGDYIYKTVPELEK